MGSFLEEAKRSFKLLKTEQSSLDRAEEMALQGMRQQERGTGGTKFMARSENGEGFAAGMKEHVVS